MNIRIGKSGTAVHLGLWDREGTALTRRACRRRNHSSAARFRPTTDPVTCKDCLRLRAAGEPWLVKAAYGNDPATRALAEGRPAALPSDVPLAWCARCGEQYPRVSARYSARVDGNVCVACFDLLAGRQ